MVLTSRRRRSGATSSVSVGFVPPAPPAAPPRCRHGQLPAGRAARRHDVDGFRGCGHRDLDLSGAQDRAGVGLALRNCRRRGRWWCVTVCSGGWRAGMWCAAICCCWPRAIGCPPTWWWWTARISADESALTGESVPVRKVAIEPASLSATIGRAGGDATPWRSRALWWSNTQSSGAAGHGHGRCRGELRKFTVASKGEVAALAETINNMTNTLATFADQVTTVAREVGVDGRLGGQRTSRAQPAPGRTSPATSISWRRISTTQVRAIAEVATAVTRET